MNLLLEPDLISLLRMSESDVVLSYVKLRCTIGCNSVVVDDNVLGAFMHLLRDQISVVVIFHKKRVPLKPMAR